MKQCSALTLTTELSSRHRGWSLYSVFRYLLEFLFSDRTKLVGDLWRNMFC